MTSAANDGNTWHLSYDIMGRVNSQVLQTAAGTFAKATYSYNTFGQVSNLCYPGAMAATAAGAATAACYTYSYDQLGRPLNIITGYTPPDEEGNSSPIYRVQNALYNAAGQITSWQENQADSTNYLLTRSYNDQRGWVSNIRAQWRFPDNSFVERLNLTYGYLANGRVSAVTDAVNPGQSVSSYEYENLNRLTKATTPNWALQWTYDEFGNRLTQAKVPGSPGTPPEITLNYGESTNRITTAGYTYDLNGNLTAAPAVNGQPALTITYDVFDRAVNSNGTTAKYDAFGRRLARGAAPKIFFYDMGGRLLAEYSGAGAGTNPFRKIEYFAGQRLGEFTDRIGNVRFSTSTNGWRHYYPFGEEITGTASDTYKFADLYRDADTGLDYAMARYHFSTIGRFLTVDRGSIDPPNPQRWNRYSYSSNDPINFNDPSGFAPEGVKTCEPWPYCDLPGWYTGGAEPPQGRGGGAQPSLEERFAERYNVSLDCARGLFGRTARRPTDEAQFAALWAMVEQANQDRSEGVAAAASSRSILHRTPTLLSSRRLISHGRRTGRQAG